MYLLPVDVSISGNLILNLFYFIFSLSVKHIDLLKQTNRDLQTWTQVWYALSVLHNVTEDVEGPFCNLAKIILNSPNFKLNFTLQLVVKNINTDIQKQSIHFA